MSNGPRSTCGFPLAPKHLPHCTEAFRDDDGCWCDVSILEDGFRKPTARQWRAQRRQMARRSRAICRGVEP